jgi:hypothetical protein
MMMFHLLDVVRLKKSNEIYNIPHSALGTIVDIHGQGEAYTVEFVDSHGNTYEDALFAEFSEEDLELVTRG